jgi:ankyrin repeat protein
MTDRDFWRAPCVTHFAYLRHMSAATVALADCLQRAASGTDPVPDAVVCIATCTSARDAAVPVAAPLQMLGSGDGCGDGSHADLLAEFVMSTPFNLRRLNVGLSPRHAAGVVAALASAPHHGYVQHITFQRDTYDHDDVVGQLVAALGGCRQLRSLDARFVDGVRWTRVFAQSLRTVRVTANGGNCSQVLVAAVQGRTEAVRSLAADGADVNEASASGITALIAAADHGRGEVVALLLRLGAATSARTSYGWTALHGAAHHGHAAVVAQLIAADADVAAEDDDDHTALSRAASQGRIDVIGLLVAAGADINPLTDSQSQGESPLTAAAEEGHARAVETLIAAGARINDDDEPALIAAARNGHYRAVEVLLAAGAGPHSEDSRGITALMAGATHAPVVEALLAAGASVDAECDAGMTALIYAAGTEPPCARAIKLLLAAGADPDARRHGLRDRGQRRNGTALHDAARHGHSTVVSLLLAAGADVNVADFDGSPLFCACYKGHADVVSALLDHPSLTPSQPEVGSGDMPLHCAARGGYAAVTTLLIEAGHDIEAVRINSTTPLFAAAHAGRDAVVAVLLRAGAASDGGVPPLAAAVSSGQLGIVAQLLKAGADVNRTCSTPTHRWARQPLHRAAAVGHVEMADLLLDHGADVNSREESGNTPLHIAAARNFPAVVTCLLRRGATRAMQCNGLTAADMANKYSNVDVLPAFAPL